MKKNLLLLLAILMVASTGALGQVAQFDFPAVSSLIVSSKDANVSVTDMTLSAGTVETNITTGTYFPNKPYIEETTGWIATDQASAKCFTFTISANSGYIFSITNISFNAYATAAGPSAIGVEIDGTSITAIDAPSAALVAYNQSVSKTGLTTAVVKIQGWLNGSRTSTGAGILKIDDVVISGTVSAAGSPTLNLSNSSLTGFSYVEGSGPSTSQSYNLSGTNLTGAPGNITVTGSTNYEVSIDNVAFSSSINAAYASATLSATPVYVRLKSGLAAGSYNSETISNTGGGASQQNITASGSVYRQEPTNHATSFVSAAGTPTHTSINLSWVDATGVTVPDGYLIKASATSFAAITDPVDGTAESNGAFVKNVAASAQAATFSTLTPGTTYYFKVYPYTNSSININYKIDGTVPTTSLTTDAAPPASLLLEENFNYTAGALLTDNGWGVHSSGAGGITVNDGGLTFTDYSSIVGNAALVDSTGEDINRTFSEITSGTVYVSFLVNVTTMANGYFLNIGPSSMGTTHRGRVFIQNFDGNLQFGLSKGSATGTFSSTNYATGTTYLLVLKYEIFSGDDNDEVSLFVFENVDDYSSEPVTPTVGPLTDAAISDINPGSVALRQYSTTQDIIVDGIRVSESWSLAPLPVELTSFTAVAKDKGVELAWHTATEVNNYGFAIERKQIPLDPPLQGGSRAAGATGGFEKVGFVSGNGTTNSPHAYSFTDAVARGRAVYRLKQIDNDGKFEYSNEVEAAVSAPKEFILMQNHPNPFNPATKISFMLPASGFASLKIYDMLGREVQTLLNEAKEAGEHTVEFNASQYPSGLYFYTLRTNNFTATKKMLLVK